MIVADASQDQVMRLSPLHDVIMQDEAAELRTLAGMPVAMRIVGEETRSISLGIADLSVLARTGVKGPQAAAWLSRHGIDVPESANVWARQPDGGLVARLGRSEFFVEDARLNDGYASRVMRTLTTVVPGVYPVPRQDAALVLVGTRVPELLRQTCSVNFQQLEPSAQAVVMTQMVGVGVLAFWSASGSLPCFRLWCDPTFGPYLLTTLADIAQEMGGGIIGAERFLV